MGSFWGIRHRSEELQLEQVTVGVSGWAESVINTMRRLISNTQPTMSLSNWTYQTPTTTRRDAVLATVADQMPELYRFVYKFVACSCKLTYGTSITDSAGNHGTKTHILWDGPSHSFRSCKNCTPWSWHTFWRSKMWNVNISEMVRAKVKMIEKLF